ncbi:MAG: response regulator receiver domain [Bacteroidota bacterium]
MNSVTYQTKASEIIRNSIKSVVYIDEKAWNPFEPNVKYDKSVKEHEICKSLYKNLKDEGITLNIHRFKKGEENLPHDEKLKKYLFNDKDLVLLDWDLDTRDEEDDRLNIPALKLLNDVINQPHIHFCVIYSSTPQFDTIIKKIHSYFSGISKDQYENIQILAEPFDDLNGILGSLDTTVSPNSNLISQINAIDSQLLNNIKNITGHNFIGCITDLAISINQNLPKATAPSYFNLELISHKDDEYTLAINNTIISILHKGKNNPKSMLKNFIKHVSQDQSKSFFKLLGLDMQNHFNKLGAFINPDILNIQFNTFLHHREQMKLNGSVLGFEEFMQDVLVENAKLNLYSSELAILNSKFLNKFKPRKNKISNQEIALINCFYNGVKVQDKQFLNFGDVFKDDRERYFTCITALCDCIIRDNKSNVDFRYFFVQGSKIKIEEGIKKGDSGFISYLDKDTCIAWSFGEYVKPFQLYVPQPTIKDGKIEILDWNELEPITHQLEYLFTLKQNYTQRIANHAFNHPVRVGVDFAKK